MLTLFVTMNALILAPEARAVADGDWKPVFTEGGPRIPDEEAGEMADSLRKLINLDYKDADLSSVLRSMAWTYKLNIVTSSDIKGKVSINLQSIPVEEALKAILTINGLVYSKRGSVIYISAGDTSLVEVKTEVINLKYLAATQAQNLARSILSSKGDMKINESGSSIIITDYPANIEKVKALITELDVAPKQVLIEAKIVDITSNDLKAMGVLWDVNYTPNKGGLFDRVTRTAENLTGTVDLHEESNSLTGGQLVLNALTLKGINITATLDALVRDGRANLMASPSIAVINGQEARIVIGERFPFKERTQTTTGTTETTKFVDIGTTLKVSPIINDDGYITLKVHPEVSSLLASLDAGPRITTREADTTVRIKEGETLVIGGLIKQSDDRSDDKVPGLGDVPILGKAFSRKSHDKEQKELAVFITPKILFSREEMAALGRKENDPKSVNTLLDQTGPLSAVERIYEKAKALERCEEIFSRGKNMAYCKAQAVSHYELIYNEFPESDRAPEAEYRAALIYLNYYKDIKKAQSAFSRLISDHPESPYARMAKGQFAMTEKEEKPKKK
jgi:type IV pilus secretin PilQ/predicted competence protein